MSLDYLGNPIDTTDSITRQGLDDFIGGFLGYHPPAPKASSPPPMPTPTPRWPTRSPACC